ncbi:MAG TPA: hypothetical protein PLS22_07920 [Aquabacterium sp.]|nr:hypothetical protein [Aquabacterium sp.]
MASFKLAFGSAILASGLAFSGAASALTLSLNTAGLKADSVLTFSVAGFGSSTAAGISYRHLGNMTRLADVDVLDPDTGEMIPTPSYNQPITKVDIDIGWDLKIAPVAGNATRSGLQLIRGLRTMTLANFRLDLKNKQLVGDVILKDGTTLKQVAIYNLVKNDDLVISFKGLVLNQTQSVKNMIFTQQLQDVVASELALSAPLKATLATTDWGTIAVKVTSYKRSPAVSDKPLVAADIPAP